MNKTFLPAELENALRQYPLESLNMLGFFQSHRPLNIFRHCSSFMACGLSDEHWWYIHSKERNDFQRFLQELGAGEHFFAVIYDWMLDEVKARFNLEWTLTCNRFYLPDDIELPNHDFEISLLNPADSATIFENSNYKSFTSIGYIEEQIRNRSGVAYRHSGKLVAWAMFHDDGALGLLHVLETYRKKGIAKALVTELCKMLRKKNQIPFTSVEPSNTASLKLVNSIGFENIGTIHWVKASRKNVVC